ncbi:MAG: pilin [Candidatus Moraniibacteriota bacterium]
MRLPLFVFFSLFMIFSSTLVALPFAPAEAGIIPCGLSKPDPAILTADQGTAKCTLCHLMVGIQNIIVLLRNIMSAIAVAVIVAMAFIYITSAGDEGRMRFAKGGMVAALIGLCIILLAWVIVNFILTIPIFKNNGLVRVGWDSFLCNTASTAGP